MKSDWNQLAHKFQRVKAFIQIINLFASFCLTKIFSFDFTKYIESDKVVANYSSYADKIHSEIINKNNVTITSYLR